MVINKVRDNLGVGFGKKFISCFKQFLLELLVILYDPIVYHINSFPRIVMGVGIGLSGRAMRSPASMPNSDTGTSKYFIILNLRLQRFHPADLLHGDGFTAINGCYARGVIAAIFQRF